MDWDKFWEIFLYVAVLAVFFAVTIFIGIRSRKKANSVDGYVLGGRSVGPWLSAFAYGTSYFSAVIFIGYAGQFGWKFGTAATWIGIGNALIGSLMAWAVLGRRTRLMTKRMNSSTMPDFFGKRFSSSSLRIAAALIIFIFLIPYTASLYNGLGRLFDVAFGGGFELWVIIMAVVTGVYVIIGGYIASAWNDFIQGIIMLFGIVAVIAAVLVGFGGFGEAMTALSQVVSETSSQSGVFTSFFGPDLYSLIMVILLTSLGTWGLPQMVQKFYAIKSDSAIKKGMVISTVFALIVAGGCYFLGSFAQIVPDASSTAYDAIVPTMLDNLNNIGIMALVLVLVMSASMSTLSSLVMTSSSTITLDLVKGYIKKDMKEKRQVLNIRIFVLIFIILSAVIAIIQKNYNLSFIAQMMGVSWGAIAGSFLAPYVLGLFSKKISKASCWACFGFGVAMSIVSLALTMSGVTKDNQLFTAGGNWFLYGVFSSPIFTGVWTMLAGFVIVPVVSIFTKKPDKAHVDRLFECYNVVHDSQLLVPVEPVPVPKSYGINADEDNNKNTE